MHQPFRRILGKRHQPVDRFQSRQDLQAFVKILQRSSRTLEPAHGSVVVHCNHQPVTQRPGLFQAIDVARVQQIETTVGHDYLFPPAPAAFERAEQVLRLHPFLRAGASGARIQFSRADGRRAQFPDGNSGCRVGKAGRLAVTVAGSKRCRKHRYHGIAGAGDVKHLMCLSRQIDDFTPCPVHQRHAAIAPGNQHGVQRQFVTQGPGSGADFVFTQAFTCNALEFPVVRRQH